MSPGKAKQRTPNSSLARPTLFHVTHSGAEGQCEQGSCIPEGRQKKLKLFCRRHRKAATQCQLFVGYGQLSKVLCR